MVCLLGRFVFGASINGVPKGNIDLLPSRREERELSCCIPFK